MKASILHTEFAAKLRHAAISQADFARLCGVTTTVVSYWCTGRRPVPQWAVALCAALKTFEPGELLVATEFQWHEVFCYVEDCALEVDPGEVHLREVRSLKVRPAEVRPAEVRFDRGLFCPPIIPSIDSLSEPFKMVRICHLRGAC